MWGVVQIGACPFHAAATSAGMIGCTGGSLTFMFYCSELPAFRRVDGVCVCENEDKTQFDGTRSFSIYFERSLSRSCSYSWREEEREEIVRDERRGKLQHTRTTSVKGTYYKYEIIVSGFLATYAVFLGMTF